MTTMIFKRSSVKKKKKKRRRKRSPLLDILEFELAVLCGYVISCIICVKVLGYSGDIRKISWFVWLPCVIGTALISHKLDEL